MLQLDSISISDAASGSSGVFSLRLQNNGLGDFVGSHKVCLVPPAGVSAVAASGRSSDWKASPDVMTLLGSPSQRCFSVPGLRARTLSTLPPIKLTWPAELKTLDFGLQMEQPAEVGGAPQLVTVAVRVLLSAATLTSCDELCICKSSDLARFTLSHECRAQLPPGSHCHLAKPAHSGSNWASGVVDQPGASAVPAVPQLVALASWGGRSRLLAAPRTRNEPLGRPEPPMRGCGVAVRPGRSRRFCGFRLPQVDEYFAYKATGYLQAKPQPQTQCGLDVFGACRPAEGPSP